MCIASQFANQILGTANQLRNAEQKVRIKKMICEAVQSMHRTGFAAALRDRNRQHDQPETPGAATAQPGASPELASSGLLIKR